MLERRMWGTSKKETGTNAFSCDFQKCQKNNGKGGLKRLATSVSLPNGVGLLINIEEMFCTFSTYKILVENGHEVRK